MKHKLDKVLNFVNRIRKELGYKPLKKLPKGNRHDGSFCPLARAFKSDNVGISFIKFPTKNITKIQKIFQTETCIETNEFTGLRTPDILSDFIEAFDDHKYPELELPEEVK